MDSFRLNAQYNIYCRSEKTRYGFRHLAELCLGGCVVEKSKACYYNRTWESYEYQSVIHALLQKYFPSGRASRFMKKLDAMATGAINRRFGTVAAVAKLGDLLCSKPEEKNAWKKRMLGTVSGVDFPDDFDALPEEEKQKRLDGAITAISS